jgi:putative hydrolase of the HAD superfamily
VLSRMTIEAVLWDFGGVFTPSPFGAATAYAHAIGAEPAVLMDVVFGSYDTDGDHVWHQLERGEVSLVDALADIAVAAEAAGFRFEAREMFAAMRSDEIDRSIVVDSVRAVRARGVRTGIITNNIREYGDAWRGQIPIDELFDTIADSSQEGVRKPNPVIFHTALERLGVTQPSHAVFLDDYEGNVVAARAVGLHGIVVEADPRPAIDALDALLDRELGSHHRSKEART